MKIDKPLIGCVVGVILLASVCFLTFSRPILQGWRFCTPQDEIYQAILTNLQSWKSYFRGLPDGKHHPLRFKVSGEDFIVIAYSSSGGSKPTYLFVPTISSRDDIYGKSGYAYSSEGIPQLDVRYEVQHLNEDIYCYRMK